MPSVETFECNEQAVLWEFVSRDEAGELVLASPVEIDVRWEDCHKVVIDSRGNTVTLTAEVVVKQDIPINSLMLYGSMEHWTGSGSGAEDNELMEVVTLDRYPDLKARHFRRIAGLIKFRGALP